MAGDVPLHAEAEPALGGRSRDARPRGRLLGDHDDAGHALVRGRGGLLQERDRLEVLFDPVGATLILYTLHAPEKHAGERDRVSLLQVIN